MQCPICGGPLVASSTVTNEDEQEVYRKRKCSGCGHEFYTVEYEVIANDRFMKEVKKWQQINWKRNNLKRKEKKNG
jgi:transcriptional regulator NrdR family protein